ncbi:AraD1 family protein [Piscinibacter sp.]|uniref:AraD1 family protein n=1 Tax=Piscinibacter sp. TaxID=1903157 RepID=UPI002C18D1BB|nr:AraD1 family protein [Albitalea sp.]HUG26346.1 AraD1 family protein [Albitalea sp.]
MLLIQFKTADSQTRVGVLEAEQGHVRPIAGVDSTYALAQSAIARQTSLERCVAEASFDEPLRYDTLAAEGRLLPPLTHPDDAHCFVTGTGLTHLGSAESRNAMHQKLAQAETLTDSMKMFRLGLEGGRPAPGRVGVAPEWFYKGDGSIVRASGEPMEMPDFALDGGDESEIVGLYVNGPDGTPHRLGFALGNEFSDHVIEQQNYLYLAHSKLRVCSVGPALRVGALPAHVDGQARLRDAQGQLRWERPFVSGEANMSHTIANLEHHHFKYRLFRRPGDAHLHFFGAAVLSFADDIQVQPGESWEIESPLFGPPLVNRLAVQPGDDAAVRPL